MKPLFILPFLFLAACASKPPKKIVIIPAVEPSRMVRNATSVRTPEQIKQYQFGRYVDAGDRFVMHESHPVFRIERSANWNLRPNLGDQTAVAATVTPQAIESSDAVVAEVNNQKAATKAFTDQAATLNQRLQNLATALTQTEKVAQENLLLKKSIGTITDRMDALEKRVRDNAPKSDRKPSATTDENW